MVRGMRRLRGVFLAAMGADENAIEASFDKAISIRTGTKIGSFGDTCRSILGRIPSPENDGITRTEITAASLLKFSWRSTQFEVDGTMG